MAWLRCAFVLLLVLALGPAAAPAPAPAAAPAVTLRADRVLDGRGGVLEGATVTVAGSRISAVGAVGPGTGATPTYDLRGLTLLPGGIDTHVHIGWHFDRDGKSHDDEERAETPAQAVLFAVENAVATVEGGITTVQSLGASARSTATCATFSPAAPFRARAC